jgi:hypothetical protein
VSDRSINLMAARLSIASELSVSGGEGEQQAVTLGTWWLDTTRKRVRKLDAERRAQLAGLGLGWATHSPGSRGPYGSDSQDLAEQWTARCVEWRRMAALMDEEGWALYRPEQDVQDSTWAREREDRRTDAWPVRPRGIRNSRTCAMS